MATVALNHALDPMFSGLLACLGLLAVYILYYYPPKLPNFVVLVESSHIAVEVYKTGAVEVYKTGAVSTRISSAIAARNRASPIGLEKKS